MKQIFSVLFIIVVSVMGYFGYNYYQETYHATVAYAQVPAEVPALEQTVDDAGDPIKNYHSYNYMFDFVLENGDHQQMHYEVSDENPEPLKPGSYVKAEISKKRVVKGPNSVDFNQMPQNVQNQLSE
jgi:Protein of unknown function (DUF1093).